MSPEEKKRVVAWGENLSNRIELDLVVNNDPRGDQLAEFCDTFSKAAPAVMLNKAENHTVPMPYIQAEKNIIYHAVPLGKELAPFLGLFSPDEQTTSPLSRGSLSNLEKIPAGTALRLYITPACPFCPSVVEKLVTLAQQCKHLHLSIIDGTLFHEIAEKENISSAPTLVYNKHFRWTGPVNLDEVVEVLSASRPEELSVSAMRTMLEEGNASRLAELMIESGDLYPAFLELLTHEKWPVRLGAMVAMEELAARDRKLAATAVDPLWQKFPELEDSIRGDMIYIMGESGDEKVIPLFKSIINGGFNDEIKETAKEALENIVKFHSSL